MKIFFIIISILFFLLLFCGKLFVFEKQKANFVSIYSAVTSAVILVYSVSAFLMLTNCDYYNGVIMLVLALSPFIIGQLTTHRTVHFFTGFQLAFILFGVSYVIFML